MSSLRDLCFQSAATFTFVEEIGRGGMGIVYLAEKHCEGVSDLVVIKTIRSISDKQLNMLKGEANIAAALRHENIVRTFGLEAIPFDRLPVEFQDELQSYHELDGSGGDKGKELLSDLRMGQFRTLADFTEQPMLLSDLNATGKRLYLIVMEYIEGWDLREIHSKHIRAGSLLPITLNAFIISRLGRALEYAHQYIVHHDVSPENILISHQGVTKLMDFGIAVAADQEAFGLAGKIQYMAPEQVRNELVDNRSDIEKKFIYAKGFGPTNNSLAAYLKMFESDFQIYTKEDLQQLAFMADEDNKYRLKRAIRKDLYTEKGRQLLQARRSHS